MTTKRRTLAEREAEALQAETPAPVAEPASAAPPAPKKKAPPTSKGPVISKEKVTDYQQIAARVPPEVRAAYVEVVNSGEFGNGRQVVIRALELLFLQVEPFNEYTRELHEREKSRRSRRR